MRTLVLSTAALALGGCYTGALKGDDGSTLRLSGGVLVVCETPDGSLAAFGAAGSYNACPHQLDTAPPTDSDTATGPVDTSDTSDTADTGTTVDPSDETSQTDTSGGICGFYKEVFDNPAYCQPWRVQANSPANAHTFNVWFENVPSRDDLTGIKTPEAILAHCPDPNHELPTTATSLDGAIEVTRDNGRKATVQLDTNMGTGKLKFQVCR